MEINNTLFLFGSPFRPRVRLARTQTHAKQASRVGSPKLPLLVPKRAKKGACACGPPFPLSVAGGPLRLEHVEEALDLALDVVTDLFLLLGGGVGSVSVWLMGGGWWWW